MSNTCTIEGCKNPTVAKGLCGELLQLTDQHIALTFRVPLAILGLGGAPLGSTEALMQFWLASGLGFALNHIEQAFDKLFGLSGLPVSMHRLVET